MALFDLIVDEKVAVWRRSFITVEAETLEEAVKDCLERGADAAIDTLGSNYIFETEEYLPPSYKDRFTIEVMDKRHKILGNNETFSR